jgi:hypothetical protein
LFSRRLFQQQQQLAGARLLVLTAVRGQGFVLPIPGAIVQCCFCVMILFAVCHLK